METRLLIISLLLTLLPSGKTLPSGCIVVEQASGNRKPCQFPFIFAGKSYEECTRDHDPNEKFWCSTNVTASGYHIHGGQSFIKVQSLLTKIMLFLGDFWGHCSDRICFLSPSNSNSNDDDDKDSQFRLDTRYKNSDQDTVLGNSKQPILLEQVL